MLSNEQRELFEHLLDANWRLGQALDQGDNQLALHFQESFNALRNKLKESMGEEAYNDFINMGKKMFAPKSN